MSLKELIYNITDKVIRTNFQILQENKADITSGAGAPDSSLDSNFYVDTTNSRLYVKVDGTWKYVGVT